MGKKAVKIFEDANAAGGMVAKIRLAEAWKKVQADLADRAAEAESEGAGRIGPAGSGAPQTAKVRKHLQTFLDLMTQRALFLGDVAETARRVDESAAEALDVARVS